MAGAVSFRRGEAYCAGGKVRALAERDGTLTAKVLGTREYRVELWVEDGDLECSCTCPIGTDGAFCKHCVAAGLAWLEQHTESPAATKKKPPKPAVTMKDVSSYLSTQSKEALVGMLMEQTAVDDRLRQRLLMQVAKTGRKGIDVATYRRAIDDAVETDGFVDYRSMRGYA
ncbi:MAG TPA: SWIM zinc finger family protein, partial [Rhodothermia bacterium]|nr:SWIM zinc finger family protein [Rhodothermia bacterium]